MLIDTLNHVSQLELFDAKTYSKALATKLFVNEIFGPTVQGEGTSAGYRATFLRLSGCNLHCRFCDSAYTWRFSEKHDHDIPTVYNGREETHPMTIDETISRLHHHGLNHRTLLVITGGEPLLQPTGVSTLLETLDKTTFWNGPVEIETAGSRPPLPDDLSVRTLIRYNVSPKLSNSGMGERERLNSDTMNEFAEMARSTMTTPVVFKFVVGELSQLDEVADIVEGFAIPNSRVWIMPEGIDHETITSRLRMLAEPVIKRGWNLTSRMHISIWGPKRGH